MDCHLRAALFYRQMSTTPLERQFAEPSGNASYSCQITCDCFLKLSFGLLTYFTSLNLHEPVLKTYIKYSYKIQLSSKMRI